jgi:ribosomal protein S18 acetylase RimI-like enzyme
MGEESKPPTEARPPRRRERELARALEAAAKVDNVRVRPAALTDLDAVRAIAVAAYARYVKRIGREPEPMRKDYAEAVERGTLHVLDLDGRVVGLIEMEAVEDQLLCENAAIHPDWQGWGIGVHLLAAAQETARARGLKYLKLYTNARMRENIRLYGLLGFVESERRVERGYDRVFMVKRLDG